MVGFTICVGCIKLADFPGREKRIAKERRITFINSVYDLEIVGRR
jgi:hypothetical protein